MSERSPRAIVDELARLAAGAEPPPLDDTGARRLVERALIDARRAPAPAVRSPRWPIAVGAALAIAAALLAFGWRGAATSAPPSPVEPALSQIVLPTGDRLAASAGARFDVDELAPASRRLRVRHGTIVFDVAPVAPAQRFEVAGDDFVAVAKGTVFSVALDAGGSRVHVFEGVVEVTWRTQTSRLAAGETWTNHPGVAITAAGDEPAAVIAEATAAVKRRASRGVDPAPAVVASTVDPKPAVESPTVATSSAATVPPAPAPPAPSVVADEPARAPSIVAGESAHAPSTGDPRRAPPARAPSAADPRRAPPTLDALLAEARAAIAAGTLDAALALVDAAEARGPLPGPWLIVRGDALRGLGRPTEAARAFAAAAAALTGVERAEAGYTAAYIRFHDLHDPEAALAVLPAELDAPDSPLAERGLALRTQLDEALGHRDDARARAEQYLARFPRGELRAYMIKLARR